MATMETGEVSSVLTPRFTSNAKEYLDRHSCQAVGYRRVRDAVGLRFDPC